MDFFKKNGFFNNPGQAGPRASQPGLRGSEACLAGSEAWLDGSKACLAGSWALEGGNGWTDGRKISPFYKTSSPTGAAALLPLK